MATDTLDYRDILRRYMAHVQASEGDTLLPDGSGRTTGGVPSTSFTPAELGALEAIEAKILGDLIWVAAE